MTTNQIGIIYNEFFGNGYWEKQYKGHIVCFAEKVMKAAQNNAEPPAIPQQPLCATGHEAKLPPCCDGEICHSKNKCDAWRNFTKR